MSSWSFVLCVQGQSQAGTGLVFIAPLKEFQLTNTSCRVSTIGQRFVEEPHTGLMVSTNILDV